LVYTFAKATQNPWVDFRYTRFQFLKVPLWENKEESMKFYSTYGEIEDISPQGNGDVVAFKTLNWKLPFLWHKEYNKNKKKKTKTFRIPNTSIIAKITSKVKCNSCCGFGHHSEVCPKDLSLFLAELPKENVIFPSKPSNLATKKSVPKKTPPKEPTPKEPPPKETPSKEPKIQTQDKEDKQGKNRIETRNIAGINVHNIDKNKEPNKESKKLLELSEQINKKNKRKIKPKSQKTPTEKTSSTGRSLKSNSKYHGYKMDNEESEEGTDEWDALYEDDEN